MASRINRRIYKKLNRIFGNIYNLASNLTLRAPNYMDLYLYRLSDGEGSITMKLGHYSREGRLWLPDPEMRIRAYPTMELAEALTYSGEGDQRHTDVYPVTGEVDEVAKYQLNNFLNLWLKHVIKRGYITDEQFSEALRGPQITNPQPQ